MNRNTPACAMKRRNERGQGALRGGIGKRVPSGLGGAAVSDPKPSTEARAGHG